MIGATGQPAADMVLAIASTSTTEAVVFWVCAPIMIVFALGCVLSRHPVRSALFLAGVMLLLAVLYGAQQAPFLAFVQVIVYTGAIMMLFLFVLMLVGVDTSDSLLETLRGQRVAGILFGVGFLGLLVFGIGHAVSTMTDVGLEQANSNGNIQGLADLMFSRYVFAFEMTSALLITAALAAMVLTHREQVLPRVTQKRLMEERFAPGGRATPLPGPGVYADHDAVDTPALLPDGSVAAGSVTGLLADVSRARYPERYARTPSARAGALPSEVDPVVASDAAQLDSSVGMAAGTGPEERP